MHISISSQTITPPIKMPSLRCRLLIFLSIVLQLSPAEVLADSPQTIYSQDAFSVLASCAQYCFTYSLSGCRTDVLGVSLQCPNKECVTTFGAPDSCYCRSDKQSVALSVLSTCVKSSCTAGNSAVDIS